MHMIFDKIDDRVIDDVKRRLITRDRALDDYYAAERRAGIEPKTAFNRMEEFRARLNQALATAENRK